MGRAKYDLRQVIIDANMKGKSPLSILLVTFLLATFIVQSVHAYENMQYGFSITPPEGWALEENIKSTLFVFRDPSNYTGATITILANQSGLPQDDLFLTSRTHNYLIRYLYENYEGCLITKNGAKVVSNLNGYQIKFNATVDGREMRFDSVIFVQTNQTFYIVCGALSPVYDNLSLVFDESINSFRLFPFSQSNNKYIPQDSAVWVWIGTVAVIGVSVAPSLIYFYKRKQKQKFHKFHG